MYKKLKIIVVGGDGYCGWPTSLHLSDRGHEILIIDNLSRRKIDIELGVDSLTPISSMHERIESWSELSGNRIGFEFIDVAVEYDKLIQVLKFFQPDAIIHFGEQRSAPYSMKNSSTRRYTISNNINATNNILSAIVELELNTHLVHLGTMGVYGYSTSGFKLPEGYVKAVFKLKDDMGNEIITEENEILYPPDPGSIYHLTKTQDALSFAYYNKNYGLQITDLHQGIVWGTNTKLTSRDPRLFNRFDYDGDYGTVLNRFLVQSSQNLPLTVHGKGLQTRAFINIEDTARCIRLAVENPTDNSDKVRIFNQLAETHTVLSVAKMVSSFTGAEIINIPNPRKEDEEHELSVSNNNLVQLGFKPILLNENLLEEVKMITDSYKHRCDHKLIPCTSKW